jgi:hypothetical protein
VSGDGTQGAAAQHEKEKRTRAINNRSCASREIAAEVRRVRDFDVPLNPSARV